MAEYHTKQPGDVLRLAADWKDYPAGDYVLLQCGAMCCLSRLGENEDGDLCTTNRLLDVPLADLSLFAPQELRLELLP